MIISVLHTRQKTTQTDNQDWQHHWSAGERDVIIWRGKCPQIYTFTLEMTLTQRVMNFFFFIDPVSKYPINITAVKIPLSHINIAYRDNNKSKIINKPFVGWIMADMFWKPVWKQLLFFVCDKLSSSSKCYAINATFLSSFG